MRKLIAVLGFCCITAGAFSQGRDKYERSATKTVKYEDPGSVSYVVDTVETTFIAYIRCPGLIFTKPGYCIRKNGRCIRNHLDYKKRPLRPILHVISCIPEEEEEEVKRGE